MKTLSEKAQELLDGRRRAVEQLGSAHEELEAVEAKYAEDLASARRRVSEAYSAATSAGWTERELRVLGIQRPTAKRSGRPKGSRNKARTSTVTTSDATVVPNE